MHLPVRSIDEAPADSRPVLDGVVADLGFVPNLALAAAASPALVLGLDALRRATGSAKLDPVLRETAGAAAGAAIGNHYGIAYHSTVLARLGAAEDQIAPLRRGGTPADPVAAAVATLAREVVLGRGTVRDATVAAATEAGLSTEAILEVVLECAFATLVGLVDNLAGQVELDEGLAPRAWTAPEQQAAAGAR